MYISMKSFGGKNNWSSHGFKYLIWQDRIVSDYFIWQDHIVFKCLIPQDIWFSSVLYYKITWFSNVQYIWFSSILYAKFMWFSNVWYHKIFGFQVFCMTRSHGFQMFNITIILNDKITCPGKVWAAATLDQPPGRPGNSCQIYLHNVGAWQVFICICTLSFPCIFNVWPYIMQCLPNP